jgi:hypothetical protein
MIFPTARSKAERNVSIKNISNVQNELKATIVNPKLKTININPRPNALKVWGCS